MQVAHSQIPLPLQIFLYLLMFILGAVMGSFLCCQARRIHYRDTHKNQKMNKRSVCLHCKKQLKWYDNIPIISWVILQGKCRYCKHKIGVAEIIAEISGALMLLILSIIISNIPLLVVTSVFVLALLFLAIYDGLYGALPLVVLTFSIICAILIITLRLWAQYSISGFSWSPLIDTAISVAILGGLYLLLYIISKGSWVGSGDWLLGTALGLALGAPLPALVALFTANLTACLAYPFVKKSHHQLYFAPFLVLGYILTIIVIQ